MSSRSLVLLAFLAASPTFADDAARLASCPPKGDAKIESVRALNVLKRRMNAPRAEEIDSKVTLAAMVAPGNDEYRFNENRGAVIEGYVADVKVGGIESVNCHTRQPYYRDTHIELTLDAKHPEDESEHVIVEVTPQVRAVMAKAGTDWSTAALRMSILGRWIRVTGWLLYDAEHAPNAANTHEGKAHIWRATVWEIHPITAIEVLPGKP
jgi:hypothetical protein